MPHPDLLPPPGQRPDMRSPLMKAKEAATKGEKVNFCQKVHQDNAWGEGCPDGRLDENGYCRHLVGFTTDQKTYEPMHKDDKGRRVVRCRTKQVGYEIEEEEVEEKDKDGNTTGYHLERRKVPIIKPVLERVQPGDVLVQITSSYRVYRKAPESVVYHKNAEDQRKELEAKIEELQMELETLPDEQTTALPV